MYPKDIITYAAGRNEAVTDGAEGVGGAAEPSSDSRNVRDKRPTGKTGSEKGTQGRGCGCGTRVTRQDVEPTTQ